MKGIKLTPFLLFIILLVVLVVAMIFGYKSSTFSEGLTPNTQWTEVSSTSITAYNDGILLDEIMPVIGSKPGIFFDKSNGNVIVTDDIMSKSYTVLNRESNGTPTAVTSDSPDTTTYSASVTDLNNPWSYTVGSLTILYSPFNTNTLILVVNNTNNTISQIFKHMEGKSIAYAQQSTPLGITANVSASVYAKITPTTVTPITVDGTTFSASTIAKDVYYTPEKGICVGTSGNFSTSQDFIERVSIQNNPAGTILVVTTLIEPTTLLATIIVNDNAGIVIASSNALPYINMSSTSDPISPAADNDDITITLDTPDVKSNQSKQDTQFADLINKLGHPNGIDGASTSKCDYSDYIRKSEIVPPVCPQCPNINIPASTSCNLSINDKGEIVDCNGKKYTPSDVLPGYTSSSPASWSSAIDDTATAAGSAIGDTATAAGSAIEKTADVVGDVAEQTVDTAGNVVGKTLDTAENVVGKTFDAAGNVVDKTFDAAGNVVDKTFDAAGNVVHGVGQGIGALGRGTADVVTDVAGDVSGVANTMVRSTAGMVNNAINAPRQQAMPQQIPQIQLLPQGYFHPQGHPHMYSSCCNKQPGMNYRNYSSSSNFMPITSDFSQFT